MFIKEYLVIFCQILTKGNQCVQYSHTIFLRRALSVVKPDYTSLKFQIIYTFAILQQAASLQIGTISRCNFIILYLSSNEVTFMDLEWLYAEHSILQTKHRLYENYLFDYHPRE